MENENKNKANNVSKNNEKLLLSDVIVSVCDKIKCDNDCKICSQGKNTYCTGYIEAN